MSGPSGIMSDFNGTVEFNLESVNWETVCKLVIDENAKLRESNDMLAKLLGDRTADCCKLRELVKDMWLYDYAGKFSSKREDMEHVAMVYQRMRELRIEVDG